MSDRSMVEIQNIQSNSPKQDKLLVDNPRILGKEKGIRSAGLTRETNIPGTDIKRGIVTRFERGQILKGYQALRDEIRGIEEKRRIMFELGQVSEGFEMIDLKDRGKEALGVFKEKVKRLEKDLDTLNSQFYDKAERKGDPGVTTIEIDDPELGKHGIPVVTLDLNPPAEGQEDARVPYFIVPAYVTNPHESASFSMALALAGEKVMIMTYPEKFKMARTQGDWIERVKRRGGLDIYADLAKKIAQGMDLEKPNLVGVSMGAAVSLEMVSDPNFAVNDLIIIEPPTVVDKGTLEQLFDFGIREGVPAMLNAEERTKVVTSESPELAQRMPGTDTALAPILARKQITQEMLRNINPSGKYQVWFGENSVITGEETRQEFLDAEQARLAASSEAKPIEMFVLKGGRHGSAAVHSEGVASKIVAKEPVGQTITELNVSDLENSAARLILNRI